MKIGIIGAGPSGMFMLKRLIEQGDPNLEIEFFEKGKNPGEGMPYSRNGANDEHITNVSANEIPELVTSLDDWVKTLDSGTLSRFDIDVDKFHEYKVVPRLLFGCYLADQFKLLLRRAKEAGIKCTMHFNAEVSDISNDEERSLVNIHVGEEMSTFDKIVICSGHYWPKKNEGVYPNYYDSPYPPSKLEFKVNGPVAIRGASLTAIDALRTLARQHGTFEKKDGDSIFRYHLDPAYPNFKLVSHSKKGLLPAVRFHLEDSYLGKDLVLKKEEIEKVREENDGFVPLDYVFDKLFKQLMKEKDPEAYEEIRDMEIEDFVEMIMSKREHIDPFKLLKAEYKEAEKSITRRESVHWKELLAVVSFAMNNPAKYFSAEDRHRLEKVLMPLISIVIAFIPQSSAEEMLALHAAGILTVTDVGEESRVEPKVSGGAIYHLRDENGKMHSDEYPVFIDSIGQPHLSYEEFPFPTIRQQGLITPATLRYRSKEAGKKELQSGNKNVLVDERGDYYLRVPGIAINDSFQVVNKYQAVNDRIFVMAVPFIGGYNPDYSGLDFCEAASEKIAKAIYHSTSVTLNEQPA